MFCQEQAPAPDCGFPKTCEGNGKEKPCRCCLSKDVGHTGPHECSHHTWYEEIPTVKRNAWGVPMADEVIERQGCCKEDVQPCSTDEEKGTRENPYRTKARYSWLCQACLTNNDSTCFASMNLRSTSFYCRQCAACHSLEA